MNNFVWIFKKSPEFELRHSVRLVRKFYPDADCWVIGDKPKQVIMDKHIPYKADLTKLRSTRVVEMLKLACDNVDEFILMYDDIFINKSFDLDKYYYKDELYNRSRGHGYQKCISNVHDFLLYHNKPILNYECHQPQKFNSKQLLDVIDMNECVLKSLYANYYELGGEKIINLKTRGNVRKKAEMYWKEYGCFSTGDEMPSVLRTYIESL